MEYFDPTDLQKLYRPADTSHKGQNGKLLFIGGSTLFHAASLWPLEIASRIVDMVFYASVPENNEIVQRAKEEWRSGIVVRRADLAEYIAQSDAILLGPGMVRQDADFDKNKKITSLKDIEDIADEGEQTYFLTKYLLQKYPEKKWIIDAGALQMLSPDWLLPLKGNVVITPHMQEFERLFDLDPNATNAGDMAQKYNCVIVLKRHIDTVASPGACILVAGGNSGMTKGGTGDVLAGLIAALACKNDVFLAAKCGSYLNKKAGESLFAKQGIYFNASDLAKEIPVVMGKLLQ